jgi:hypothetical protein
MKNRDNKNGAQKNGAKKMVPGPNKIKMVPGPIFKRSDGRGSCKMGPGTIFFTLRGAKKIPSLCSGQMWQSLKKRKRDEHREVIEYAV